MSQPVNLRDLLKMAQEVSKQPGGTQQMAVALKNMQQEKSHSAYAQVGEKSKQSGLTWTNYHQIKTDGGASTIPPAGPTITPSRRGAGFWVGCFIGILIAQAWLHFGQGLSAVGLTDSSVGQFFLQVMNVLVAPTKWLMEWLDIPFSNLAANQPSSIKLLDGLIDVPLKWVEVSFVGITAFVYGCLVRLQEAVIQRDMH